MRTGTLPLCIPPSNLIDRRMEIRKAVTYFLCVLFFQWNLQLLVKVNVQPSKSNYIDGIVYRKIDEESIE
jgi:hypothetical protein